MEKGLLRHVQVQAAPAAERPRHRYVLMKCATAGLFLLAFLNRPTEGTWFPFGASNPYAVNEAFSWDSLKTQPHLEYTDCYTEAENGPFQCARVEVPMDYWNGTTDAKVSLPVIRKAAKVDVLSNQYGGAVLLNPGGPGGSGIGLLSGRSKSISETIDSADGKYFDLISFDPRGVGEFRPKIQCIEDRRWAQSWQVRVMEEGMYEASDASFGRLWSMMEAWAGTCSMLLEDGEADIRKYVTTASVARDMLEIVEKHGAWREKEAKRLLSERTFCKKSKAAMSEVPRSVLYKPGEEKIQYWGFR